MKVINDNEGGFEKFSKVWRLISISRAFLFCLPYSIFSSEEKIKLKRHMNNT